MKQIRQILLILTQVLGLISISVITVFVLENLISIQIIDLQYITKSVDSNILEDIVFIDQSEDCPISYINLINYEYQGHVNFIKNYCMYFNQVFNKQESGCYCSQNEIYFKMNCSQIADTICDINIDFNIQERNAFQVFPLPQSKSAFKVCGKYSESFHKRQNNIDNLSCDEQTMQLCGRLCIDKNNKCPVNKIMILNQIEDKDYIDSKNILNNSEQYTVFRKDNTDNIIVLYHSKEVDEYPLTQIKVTKLPFMCQNEDIAKNMEFRNTFGNSDINLSCSPDDLFHEINKSKIIGSQYFEVNQEQVQNQLKELYDMNEYKLFMKNALFLSNQCYSDSDIIEFINSFDLMYTNLQIRFIVICISIFIITVITLIASYLIRNDKIKIKSYNYLIIICNLLLISAHLSIFLLNNIYKDNFQRIQELQCFEIQYNSINEIINNSKQKMQFIVKLQFMCTLITLLQMIAVILINFIAECWLSKQLKEQNINKQNTDVQIVELRNIQQNDIFKDDLIQNNIIQTYNINPLILSQNFFSSEQIKSEIIPNQTNVRIELIQ